MITCVVAFDDHRLSVADDELNSTLPPVQKDVAPLAVITGVVGRALTVMFITTRGLSSPFAFF